MAVITSRSFDGEYIARIIELFGFSAVRGSSSRGGSGALLGMNRVLANGHIAAFTIDGPRGPRYVAKPGPVLLAKMSGVPILCFYLAVERPWILRSWDADDDSAALLQGACSLDETDSGSGGGERRRDEAVPPADAGFAGAGAARRGGGAGRAGQLDVVTTKFKQEGSEAVMNVRTLILLSPRSGAGSGRRRIDPQRAASQRRGCCCRPGCDAGGVRLHGQHDDRLEL